jgi:hypothetical protein
MRFSILLNCNLAPFFKFSWLERRGPYVSIVFVILIEALSRMSFAAVSGGLLSGFSVGTENVGGFDFLWMKSLGLMGWVSRNSLGAGGRSVLDFLNSRCVTDQRLVFGMLCGVGNDP